MEGSEGYVLGIDGGGTATRAMLADLSGRIRGSGTSSGSNINFAGKANAESALRSAVEQALRAGGVDPRSVAAIFCGVAGAGSRSNQEFVASAIRGMGFAAHAKVEVDRDLRVAWAGGLDGEPGIVLIAGTGSSCYGRDAKGREAVCGGWGFPVDDVGSGSWMGLSALRVVARQTDGRVAKTGMLEAVLEALSAESLKRYLDTALRSGLNRAELARLAPVVMRSAGEGDEHASRILSEGAEGLAELVAATAKPLDMPEAKVALTGGLLSAGAPFRLLVEEAIVRLAPECGCIAPRRSSVAGAVIEAARLAGVEVSECFFRNLSGAAGD